MVKTLHILNGDSTLNQFEQTSIDGDTFVWREVLSEGPVSTKISTKQFWEERGQFMTQYFKTSFEEYEKRVVKPFKKLEQNINEYKEIVLWFEYDLFCQINMIALLSWMKDLNPNGQVSLICVGRFEESDRLLGLGEISSSIYPDLLNNRVKLGTREFTHAQDVWQTYCSDNPEDLYNFILLKMTEFEYLPMALEAHLKRFPFRESGLNEIEQKVVALYVSGIREDHKIVDELLRWQNAYGFGDLQYFNIVDFLRPVLYRIDSTGKIPSSETINGLLNRDYSLGGAKESDFEWDENEEALIPKESMP